MFREIFNNKILSLQAIDAAVKALKQGSVSNSDVTKAKEQLRLAYLSEYDTDSGILSDIGAQAVLAGSVTSPSGVISLLDSITSTDVNAVSIKTVVQFDENYLN